MSRFLTLEEAARELRYDRNGDLTPRKLANCREWLRRKGIRCTGGGRINADLFFAALDAIERTPKPKATAAQQAARNLNLSHRAAQRDHVGTFNHAAQSAKADAGTKLNSLEGGAR